MTNENMQIVLDKIKQYNKIFIFRHFRPDGDAIGSTKGMQAILRASFPEKTILLQNEDFSEYLAFLGPEDALVPDEEYKDALALVLDTATAKRVSNQRFKLCAEVVKFDHHIPIESYGNAEWVEEERSSTCEMVTAFFDAFSDELTMTKEAATYLYTGMVTDSGRFRFRDVSSETMRLAGTLLTYGIDTDTLYAHLYMKDFDSLRFEGYLQKKMRRTENGVAYLHVTARMQKRFGLSSEDASATVSTMDSIRDSLIWLAFIDNADGSIRVRLRSRFVTVSEVAEKYSGGGHACAAGATVYSKAEMKALLADCDARLAEYKRTHEGWL